MNIISIFKVLIFLCFSMSLIFPIQSNKTFVKCLLHQYPNSNISQWVYTQNNPLYTSILDFSIRNLRFMSPNSTKPFLLLTPTNVREVQASIVCCKNHSLSIRVRSGGHDYEGLSYRSISRTQFVMIDLGNLRDIQIDAHHGVAWVQSGASLGELYYKLSQKNGTLAFPSGTCPTVCVGGIFSGGGFGMLSRKYGLSIDNILDANLVDAAGRVLNRESMGKDLFWAIRGGGGGSFGIVISWKIRLVQVPETVSVATLNRTKEQGAISLVENWQHLAPNFCEDIVLKFAIQSDKSRGTPVVIFTSFYLGGCLNMLTYMQMNFPELGLQEDDCQEMSWIQSVMYFAGYDLERPETILLDRRSEVKQYNKATTDFVTNPIPHKTWEEILNRFFYKGVGIMHIETQGGKINAVSGSDTPFPYREGVLYKIRYVVYWQDDDNHEMAEKCLGWVQEAYGFMTPYVSKNPRGAYVNFRDLDFGKNEEGKTSYEHARYWGEKYFNYNYKKLAQIKGKIDPENFFWHEQSIPPLISGLVSDS